MSGNDPLANGIPDRRIDRVLQALANLLVRIFYRRIEVRGLSRIPADGPLVVVANHGNSLIDPMVVFACLSRRSLYLAKSTLWDHPGGRYIVRLGPAIPVYRRHDPGVDPAKNQETFDRCHRALQAGKAIALFPEGLSHDEPELQPLKTGAARIVLEAEARFGPLATAILPVGLTFESRDKFRSRALVEIGDPVDPTAEQASYAEEPREAVRRLTDRIDEALRDVTLNYANWRDAELLARAAELYAQPDPEVPTRRGLGASFQTRKELLAHYRRLRESHPDEIAEVTAAVERYDRLLTTMGLEDSHVAASYPPQRIVRFLWRSVVLVLLWLPLALFGFVLNLVPYQIPKLAVRVLRRPLVEHATYKLLSAVVGFPLLWGAQAIAIGRLAGSGWGLAALLLAPLGGYAALRLSERWSRLVEEVRAYLLLRTRRRLRDELLHRRGQVQGWMSRLAELV